MEYGEIQPNIDLAGEDTTGSTLATAEEPQSLAKEAKVFGRAEVTVPTLFDKLRGNVAI